MDYPGAPDVFSELLLQERQAGSGEVGTKVKDKIKPGLIRRLLRLCRQGPAWA
jgi:hypothetical protein